MFLSRQKSGGKWESVVKTSRQIPLFQARLAEALTQAGFSKLQFWGDYAKIPFDLAKSKDLLVVGEKLERREE